MEQPKVTIILTTFNRANLIGDTLNSILAQTYANWECFIIDDNSTDGTFAYLNDTYLGDKRIQYFLKDLEHYPKGLSASRNMGLDLIVDTDFIQFFDDDDIMHPQKIELQMNEFSIYKNLDFSFFNRVLYDDLLTDKLRYGYYDKCSSHLIQDIALGYYFGKYFFTAQSPLFKKSYLSNLRFNEDIFFAEEWELFLKLFLTKKTKVSLISEPLYFHRNHSNSITTNLYGDKQAIKGTSKYKAYIEILDYVVGNNCNIPKRILIHMLFIGLENDKSESLMSKKVKAIISNDKNEFHIWILELICNLVLKYRSKLLRKMISNFLIYIY